LGDVDSDSFYTHHTWTLVSCATSSHPYHSAHPTLWHKQDGRGGCYSVARIFVWWQLNQSASVFYTFVTRLLRRF